MATCPECGAKVRKDNLKGHINKVHKKLEERPEDLAEKKTPSRIKVKKSRTVNPWPAIAIGVIMASVILGAYAYITFFSGGSENMVIVSTNYGTFKIELRKDRAPTTAGNFINLVKQGFYNGLTFHRIVPDFVIQGGDPNGDGSGGSDQNVPWENTGLKNVKYSVAMARSGNPDSAQDSGTATSQFFVNLKDNPSLDNYAYPFVVFGHVIEGQSVIDAIGQVPTDANDRPINPVIMYSVTIVK